jgi:hypothetical protein
MFAHHHYGYGGGMTDWMAHVAISRHPRADLRPDLQGDEPAHACAGCHPHRRGAGGHVYVGPGARSAGMVGLDSAAPVISITPSANGGACH